MTHLTSDELVDALDGVLETARKDHLDACPPCQQQLADLAAVLRDTRDVPVPEPSPLYWQHLSERVRAAIDAEPLTAGGWRHWLRWPVLVPIGALALIVMALMVAVPRQQPVTTTAAVTGAPDTDTEVAPAAAGDDSWVVVADLVGDIDWDTAVSAGLTVEPGAADQAVLELTAAEQQELTRLLKAELTRAKS
ncbi:MAG: hypothetical protein WC815_02405 [Vicinamibacterales bacterium]|jgi:hypothetical protein